MGDVAANKPIEVIIKGLNMVLPRAAAANCSFPSPPTMMVSTRVIEVLAIWASMTGTPSRVISRTSPPEVSHHCLSMGEDYEGDGGKYEGGMSQG